MAKITKSNAQMEALKYINDGLKMISKIDGIDKKAQSGSTTLKIGDTKVTTSDISFTIKAAKLLKGKLIGDIKVKCLKFNIDLDDSEKLLLGEVVEEAAVEGEKENIETEQGGEEQNNTESLKCETEEINSSGGLEQVEAENAELEGVVDVEITDNGLQQTEADFSIDALSSLAF